jgi:hypothetical protein
MKNIYLSGIIDCPEEENAVLEVLRSRVVLLYSFLLRMLL